MKNIFVCGFSQESNSFNPKITEMDIFQQYGVFMGGNAPEKPLCLPQANGIIEYLKNKDCNLIYGAVMRAGCGGPVNHNIVDYFLENTIKELKKVNKIDGICIALHGATLSNKTDDVCGFILEALRREVGDGVPISAAFDMHANITDKIVENVDYICGYQEYPHIDQKETGERAAERLYEKLIGNGGETAVVSIPMIAPAHGYTTANGSLKKLVEQSKNLIVNGEILDYTIFEVQPWLDISELKTTIVVIAKTAEIAKTTAKKIAKENFLIREELLGLKLFTVEDVIEKADKCETDVPVVLVDSSDSPGAGANSDSAYVIEKLLPYRNKLKAAVSVCDVQAVEKAFAIGVGNIADFDLGATIAPKLSKAVCVKNAKVLSLHCGEFLLFSSQGSDLKCYIGKTAILKADKIFIHVSSCAKEAGDINFYKSFGIDPFECDIVSVKACTSFRDVYETKTTEIYNVQTPGAAGTNLFEMPYENRPYPLYPFEEISECDISDAKICR